MFSHCMVMVSWVFWPNLEDGIENKRMHPEKKTQLKPDKYIRLSDESRYAFI